MTAGRAEVVVVGAGVMGCATAYALAQAGRRVTVLEQFSIGHNRGSSHGSSRIFRFSYPEARYVEMAIEAKGLWREIEDASGVEVLTTLGGLDAGEGIESNAAALTECGAPHEMLTGREASERFPLVRLDPAMDVLFQPDAGIVAADTALKTFADGARDAGATVLEETKVAALEPTDDGVRVHAGLGVVEADVCVVTAGAWVRDLVAPLGIELDVKPTRETIAYFALEETPPTLVEWGDPSVYALPAPGVGLKAGEHIAGPLADPDSTAEPNERSVALLKRWVADRYPSADPEPRRVETCFYTNTDDQHFILERHDRVVIGSPCSGHGFKFAPLIGQRLAALAREVLS